MVVFMTLLIIPICVKAGVICNDGWESSCDFSGPGCCSHHGGVADGGYYEGDYYSSSSDDGVGIWFYVLLFLGLPFGGYLIEEFSNRKEQRKLEEEIQRKEKERKNRERIEKARLRKIEKEKLEERKRKIGTKYNSKEIYINKVVEQLNSLNITVDNLEDGYFNIVSLDEILLDEKIDNKYISFKLIIDACYESKLHSLENKILNYKNINRTELKYYLKKFDKVIFKVEDLEKNNKIKYFDLFLNNLDKKIKCSELIKIINNSEEYYDKILDNEFIINYSAEDIVKIINNNKLYEQYLKTNVMFNYDEVYKIYSKIIMVSEDKKIHCFVDKHLNEFKLLKTNKEYNDVLELAYIYKKSLVFMKLIEIGFNPNILPLAKDQNNILNIMSNDYVWIDMNIPKDNYDNKYGLISYIESDYLFSFKSFLISYVNLDNKNVFYKGESLIFIAIKYNNLNVVNFLLEQNCNLFRITNEKNTNGLNPLIYSVYKRHYKITKLLIEKGVNINYPDIYGNTVLDYACSFVNNLDLCQFIVEHGGLPNNLKDLEKIKNAVIKNDKSLLPKVNIRKINELKK